MLLPALNMARAKAKQISCTNNLKQLGLGFQLYTSDHKYFPLYFNSVTGKDRWTETFCKNKYISNGNIMLCPSLETRADIVHGWKNMSKVLVDSNHDYSGVGWLTKPDYGYNYRHIGSGTLYGAKTLFPPATPSMIKKPTQTILVTDTLETNQTNSGYMYVVGIFTTTNYFGVLDARHNKIVNVLWLDGHATGVKVNSSNPYSSDPFRFGYSSSDVGKIDNYWDRR
jgi:prepilin-type processing-associated H-X9-DG protein